MTVIKPGHPSFQSTLVGAPKIEEFPPLTAPELQQYFTAPVTEALGRGVHPQTGCCTNGIPLFMIARIIRTIHLMSDEVTKMIDTLQDVHDSGSIDGDLLEKVSALLPPPMIKVDAPMTQAEDDAEMPQG